MVAIEVMNPSPILNIYAYEVCSPSFSGVYQQCPLLCILSLRMKGQPGVTILDVGLLAEKESLTKKCKEF